MSQANCACLRVAYRTEESRPGLIVRAWWACDLCDRVFTPVLPPLPAGLDFEKAHTDLWAPVVAKYGAEPDAVREYISPGLQRVLNAQLASRIAQAREEERADLLAEVRRLRGELDEVRSKMGPGNFGFKDGIYEICLGYHQATEDGAGEYEWLEVVAASSLASLRASHDEVVRCVREWQEAREEYEDARAHEVGLGTTEDEDEAIVDRVMAAVQRVTTASAALDAFDLGKEGA